MNTKELRIGNLVIYDEKVHRVESILSSTYLVFIHTLDREVLLSVIVNTVDPIPLTEEWLIKFGFKRVQEDKYGCHYENEECWVYLSHGGFDVEVITDDERFNLLRTYKYVHQLQNLYFSITGKELEAI